MCRERGQREEKRARQAEPGERAGGCRACVLPGILVGSHRAGGPRIAHILQLHRAPAPAPHGAALHPIKPPAATVGVTGRDTVLLKHVLHNP
eukprot:COSAG04_NODE_323_length_16882_cov_5.975627_18_plen_92_part_00